MKKPINIDDVTEDNILRVTYLVNRDERRIVKDVKENHYKAVDDNDFTCFRSFNVEGFKKTFGHSKGEWSNLELEVDDEQIHEVW